MAKIYRILFLLLIFGSTLVSAQVYTVSGKVISASTGEPLLGANVYLAGTTLGAATDMDGNYSIKAEVGVYTLTCSYIGYETKTEEVNLNQSREVNFSLKDYQFSLSVEVISDRAKERETPVAFVNIPKRDIEKKLGSRDIPLVLKSTPSVYATDNGGGAGDSRINVRGFNQRNIAIMINGVPINDMENGWVYWSNWDGLGDATSSIQLQRGLSAVNLATPSIGGTMNIITDPTKVNPGVYYKNEIGSGTFAKQTLFAHTGLIDNKFALSVGGVRKTGAGVVDRTWTDAWAYYLGAAYQLNTNNRIELYAIGAPQQHGQRSYRLNAASYSHELARELGYSNTVIDDPKLAEQGILYNPNWNSVNSSYQGKQYWNNSVGDRYSPNFIMERENYYHKPVVNLNWYSQLTNKMSLYTTFYYSGGQGGGSGTFGSMKFNTSLMQRVVDWDATIANNVASLDTLSTGRIVKSSKGILRNSVNNQTTWGAIAKTFYKVDDNLNLSFGLDWRTAEIEHYREVRDLLGGDYFYFKGNQFETTEAQYYKGLGDKIDYNFTNNVDWIGAYAQGEYNFERFTFYATAGYSTIKYKYENFFKKGPDGSTLKSETDFIGGYQFKGGASFRVTDFASVYVNGGMVNKVPIFDQVIDDQNGVKAADPQNENFMSFEAGTNLTFLNRMLNINANVYYTNWKDRADLVQVTNPDGSEGLVYLQGVSSTHMGFELDAAFQPVKYARLDMAASFGDWKYDENVSGKYRPSTSAPEQNYTYYLAGVKVGDAPQLQLAAGLSVFPFNGLSAQLLWNYNDEYYADFDPFTRTQAYFEGEQSWKIPSFSLFDLHVAYDLPVNLAGVNISIFAHVFNLFDKLYVQDATDNSSFNGYYKNNIDRNGDTKLNSSDGEHTADDAEIFPGLPRSFNLGFSVRL